MSGKVRKADQAGVPDLSTAHRFHQRPVAVVRSEVRRVAEPVRADQRRARNKRISSIRPTSTSISIRASSGAIARHRYSKPVATGSRLPAREQFIGDQSCEGLRRVPWGDGRRPLDPVPLDEGVANGARVPSVREEPGLLHRRWRAPLEREGRSIEVPRDRDSGTEEPLGLDPVRTRVQAEGLVELVQIGNTGQVGTGASGLGRTVATSRTGQHRDKQDRCRERRHPSPS